MKHRTQLKDNIMKHRPKELPLPSSINNSCDIQKNELYPSQGGRVGGKGEGGVRGEK
jgi:hypothetical protein